MSTRRLSGRFIPVVRRHDWRPGEKSLHARRNDLRSVQITLRAARNRKVVDPSEVEYLEDLHLEKLAALQAVEREHGFGPDHETVADPVIAYDRRVVQDRLTGASITALAASLEALRGQAMVKNADGTPKYPDAAEQARRIKNVLEHQLRAH